MNLSAYSPTTFNGLPSLSYARLNLARHGKLVSTLLDVIHGHELQDVVGIALLHRHFELGSDEAIVERLRPSLGDSISRIESTTQVSVPHTFQCVDGQWSPIEFVAEGTAEAAATGHALEQVRRKPGFLRSLRDVLVANGAQNSFGISLLHGRERLLGDAGHILVERTDKAQRASIVASEQLSAIAALDVTETLWVWNHDGPLLTCVCTGRGDDHAHVDKQ